MPRLWTRTIETHRAEVTNAVIDATGELVAARGFRSVTMSEIATAAGIGRATLYKYFPDVESIIQAWHGREVEHHLKILREISTGDGAPVDRLRSLLLSYARLSRGGQGAHPPAVAAALHERGQVGDAHGAVRDLIAVVVKEAVEAGQVRDDVPPAELATYCVDALGTGELTGARHLDRLVAVILDGLNP